MKANLLVWALLLSGVAMVKLSAQTLQTLVSFNGTNGADPCASLTLGNDGNFYGTTWLGGSSGKGTVFQVTTDGKLTTLVSFNGINGASPNGLALGKDGNFYGTTLEGGITNSFDPNGFGTVFRMTTNGTLTTLTTLVSSNFTIFDFTNGVHPYAALTLGIDGNFYGTTEEGGSGGGQGTVFKVTTNGTLTTLASFNNTDGASPYSELTMDTGGNFYGTTLWGGVSAAYSMGYGTMFKATTDGTLTNLVSFNGTNGQNPNGLTLGTDGNLYGTTYEGGIYGGSYGGYGTLFQVTTNGTLVTLVYFNGTNGAFPYAALTLGADGNFYGTTDIGGSSDEGTVFQVTTNGTLTTLVLFQLHQWGVTASRVDTGQ